jgi:two-component system CheB/CheR fusion protein
MPAAGMSEEDIAAVLRRLEEAEELIGAIRSGSVDAFLVGQGHQGRVYRLETADRPYRVFVETMQQGAVTLGADGVILFCNPFALDLLRLASPQVAGRMLRDFVAASDVVAFEALVSQAREGAVTGEIAIARHDGTVVPVMAVMNPLMLDQMSAISVLLTDLTERRHHEALSRAQAELRQSEEKFRTLAEALPQVVWTSDADGVLDYVNARWTQYTGLNLAQTLGPDGIAAVHPDDATTSRKRWAEAVRDGTPFETQIRCRRAIDGAYRWFLCRAVPVKDPSGRLVKWFGTSTDIDDELQAMRRKDEFVATLAHELRNPLAPIRNAVEVLHLSDQLAPDLCTARDIIGRQVAQMTRLIDDLLDVSRISLNRLQLRKARVELAAVVAQAVETIHPRADAGELELSIDVPPAAIYVDADPIRLAQVFANLLDNACKYTEPGGRVSLAVELQGSEVVVRVRDTGIGIATDFLPLLFDKFSQAVPALERAQGGLGIGLALVQGLLELHGGVVSAFSEGPGRGSECVVRLPVAQQGTPAIGESHAEHASVPKRRILVVDDNRDSTASLSMLLQMQGHDVTMAYDGLQALDICERFRPEVVLLDIGMPKLNGYDACRRIREQPWGHDVLLIAQTGWGQEEDRTRTKAAGFDAHLTKPIDPDTLYNLISMPRGMHDVARAADKTRGAVRP